VINVIEHVKDITELKKVENKYKDAFNRAEFYKDLFAHDINNILQNILTSTELCKHFTLKISNEEKFGELLSTIENQIRRGTNLVSNVRKLSKIEEIEFNLQKIDLIEVLPKVIENFKRSYPSKNLNIQYVTQNNQKYIQANELLFDVFDNLLNNATRYNRNSTIEIIIKTSEIKKDDKNYLKIEFIDNGWGIEDTRKETIFKRASMEEKSVSGMGLGLSLVKRIIESYNGFIWVEDRIKGDYTKGSNFIILIPSYFDEIKRINLISIE
jgi:signal transduction histidine kinase